MRYRIVLEYDPETRSHTATVPGLPIVVDADSEEDASGLLERQSRGIVRRREPPSRPLPSRRSRSRSSRWMCEWPACPGRSTGGVSCGPSRGSAGSSGATGKHRKLVHCESRRFFLVAFHNVIGRNAIRHLLREGAIDEEEFLKELRVLRKHDCPTTTRDQPADTRLNTPRGGAPSAARNGGSSESRGARFDGAPWSR